MLFQANSLFDLEFQAIVESHGLRGFRQSAESGKRVQNVAGGVSSISKAQQTSIIV